MTRIRHDVLAIPEDHPILGGYRATFDRYGFAPAVKSRGMLYVSDMVDVRPDGTAPEDVAEQSDWAFRRTLAMLEFAGLTMADVVDLTTYLVDIDRTLPAFMPVKERYIERPFPAWTLLGISGLSRPELLVEVRAIAALRD